jgi:hypothetical protein
MKKQKNGENKDQEHKSKSAHEISCSKVENPKSEKAKCAYYNKTRHDEHKIMKKHIAHLTLL